MIGRHDDSSSSSSSSKSMARHQHCPRCGPCTQQMQSRIGSSNKDSATWEWSSQWLFLVIICYNGLSWWIALVGNDGEAIFIMVMWNLLFSSSFSPRGRLSSGMGLKTCPAELLLPYGKPGMKIDIGCFGKNRCNRRSQWFFAAFHEFYWRYIFVNQQEFIHK